MRKWFKHNLYSRVKIPDTIQQARHWLLLAQAFLLTGIFIKVAHNVLFDIEDRGWIQYWDNRILVLISELRTGVLTSGMIDITALGSITIVVLITIVFFIISYMLKDYLGILQLGIASLGAGFWTWTFKHFVERPRPTIVSQLVSVSGHSFPSGHSLTAAALYFTFAIMLGQRMISWKHSVTLQFLASLIIICVAISRVYLGAHYPSDVLSGALFGAAWAYFVAGTIAWKNARESK